jgi:sialic acid synthase SpsE
MADSEDVTRAVNSIVTAGNDQIILLHCVSEYPTPDAAVNLRKIEGLRAMSGRPVGFSDHSRGISAALGAVTLGACVIEKHFTLDRSLPGPDHHFSCDPAELVQLVRDVRRMEALLGSAEIKPTHGEIEMRKLARRSIVAARDLAAGTVIVEEDLAYRRPGTGLLPFEACRIIGHRMVKAVRAGHIFSVEDIV